MKIPTLQGIIKRRILVNYHAEPGVIQKILPNGFRPKLQKDKAIAGICLIRLEQMRPKNVPEFIGVSSENAAHRIAVEWENKDGATNEGVFIPRRDTDSLIVSTFGGKLFSSEHHKADFQITENKHEINFSMESEDGTAFIKFKGIKSEKHPENSVFGSLAEASSFFEKGSLGYSPASDKNALDGIVLDIKNWKVKSLDLEFVESSFYGDVKIFPKGSISFDHALSMENIAHEWHTLR